MRQMMLLAFALGLAACEGGSAPGAAQEHAAAIEKAAVDESKLTPGANVTLKDGAKGCKDKAKAEEFIAASKLDDPSKSIEIWSEGMQTRTCRAFVSGLAVAVEKVEGALTCILPGDEPENKECFWVESETL